jgi:hypothetical protein
VVGQWLSMIAVVDKIRRCLLLELHGGVEKIGNYTSLMGRGWSKVSGSDLWRTHDRVVLAVQRAAPASSDVTIAR